MLKTKKAGPISSIRHLLSIQWFCFPGTCPTCLWTLGPHLMVLFWDIIESSGSRASLEEAGQWGLVLSFNARLYFLSWTGFVPVLLIWRGDFCVSPWPQCYLLPCLHPISSKIWVKINPSQQWEELPVQWLCRLALASLYNLSTTIMYLFLKIYYLYSTKSACMHACQ